MVNILELPILIPIWIIFIVLSIIIIILHWIWRYRDNIKNYCPEATLFRHARQRGIAIMQKWFMTGFFVFERLEKDKKGDMYTKLPDDSHEGIRFDPRIQSKTPKCSTINGLEIYQYGSNTPYNLTALNAASMNTVIEHVRNNYPELHFLTPQMILEFCQKNKNILIQDCMNLVSQHDTANSFNLSSEKVKAIKESLKEDITQRLGEEADPHLIDYETEKEYMIQIQKTKAELLAQVFTKIQNELVIMDIKPQFFSFSDAFQNMASCILATDMQTYKQMLDKLTELKRERFNMNFLMTIGFAVMLIIIGAGIFYTMVQGGGS